MSEHSAPYGRLARLATVTVAAMAVLGPAQAADAAAPGDIQLASVSASGDAANGDSEDVDVSRTGRLVAFTSVATDLVPADDNELADVFVRDRRADTTILVSAAPDGSVGNSQSGSPSISANGRYVAFDSFASDLVEGDTNDANDVFVRDLDEGTTTLISVDMMGGPSDSGSGDPSISPDGRYVAFESAATDLVDGEDEPLTSDVFVRDLETGLTTVVSVDVDGAAPDGESFAPAISRGGTRVAFWSSASDLVSGDTNGFDDIFVRDLVARTTERVSVAADGGDSDQLSRDPDISANGERVAFASRANNLVPDDNNGFVIDIFVRDLTAGTTVRASVDAQGGDPGDNSEGPTLSADGNLVAFYSRARDLVEPRQGDFVQDVFVRDLAAATTQLLTRDEQGRAPNGHSSWPAISNNGKVVGFESFAEDLVVGDDNGSSDAFVVRRPTTP
jgi:Tol biopolymer transport system component